jgi:hypothetical protein
MGSAAGSRPTPRKLGNQRDSLGRPVEEVPTSMAVGAGISAGSGTIYARSVVREGDIITTRYVIDLTGLSAAAAGDIIGTAGVSHFGQITDAVNGRIMGGTMVCTEAPAGGDADIDLYAAPDATGAYDGAITGLSGDTQATNAGTSSLGTTGHVIADSIDSGDYLYLVSVGATAAAYTAGRFVITLFGRVV